MSTDTERKHDFRLLEHSSESGDPAVKKSSK